MHKYSAANTHSIHCRRANSSNHFSSSCVDFLVLITKNVITSKSNEDARDKTAYFAMYGGGAIFNILHIFRGDLKRAKNHFIIKNNIECVLCVRCGGHLCYKKWE